jgi:hypothetical protein
MTWGDNRSTTFKDFYVVSVFRPKTFLFELVTFSLGKTNQ